jgi:ssDNA-binding Zn-finger/Zn-ribbon topoisomerase 1
MAHTCPDCGITCYCNGDIDDIDFGDWDGCTHYEECKDEYDEWDDGNWVHDPDMEARE